MSTSEPRGIPSRPDDLARRLAALSPAKRALLEREIRKSAITVADAKIPRRSARTCAPLSSAQQRLWFLNQLEPESVAYNEPKAFRIRGPINRSALQQALNRIVARHAVLRTTFGLRDGTPEQHIHEEGQLTLDVIDLIARPDSLRELEAAQILKEKVTRPFHLSIDLMLRACLVCLDPHEHILLLVTHHIASDGWSMGILIRELGHYYDAFESSHPSALPELAVQYADYSQWDRDRAAGASLTSQIEYWKRQLSCVPTLDLPLDRPRSRLKNYEGGKQELFLPRHLCNQLRQLGRAGHATLFMTLLTALQILLHRYTGQEDIAIGAPIASRTHPELEPLIGFFVNTLVLRTDLSGNPNFHEALRRVRDTVWTAVQNQDVPFESVVAALQPERNLGRNPFFDVVFAFQNIPTEALRLADLTVVPFELDNGTSKFDLALTMQEDGELIYGRLDFRLDLFNPPTIRRLLDHFTTLLQSIVTHPDMPISQLRIMSDTEIRQLLLEWNQNASAYPKDCSIHELFEAQVDRSPDAVAVVFENRDVTYRELDRRANQLANYLRGVEGGETPVAGICMERSLDSIVAVLAVLKSGRAYLPLDPAYPRERLAFMIRESRVSVVVTLERFASPLNELGVRTICLDRDSNQIARQSTAYRAVVAGPDDLAYVMYTSGSTGQPKGVEIPHRGVVRLLFGSGYARFGADETLLHLAPISFDASTFEIWGALLHGAKCIVYPGDVPTPAELGSLLKRHHVTTLWLTASLFNLVIDETPDALSGVRQLLIGGEALSVPHVQRALARLPETTIINGYGPTESTTFACTYRIPRRLPQSTASVPIGRPIGNTEVYVLDANLAPVPIGVAGELYISGDGLARGYHNQPELTAQKFIANPFRDSSTRRLYRTGDRVRYLEDGNIDFLGRLDNQVKVRGFRIELGEIEATLERHPAVEQTTVLLRATSARNDNHLVAYVLASQASRPTAGQLKAFLKQQLPDYMVPSTYVFVDTWPLTANGKIDRHALSSMEVRQEPDAGFVECRTELERQLAAIWARVIGVKRIGARDNFFDLGGHSLLAVRVVSEIRRALGCSVPLTVLFQRPTIEELALAVGGDLPANGWKSLMPLRSKGSRPPFFWVHGEASDPLLPRYLDREQPVYGLMHQAHDGSPVRYPTVQEIAAHYLSEVRSIRPHGPYLLGGYCFGAVVAFEMAQQLKAQREPVDLLVLLSPSPLQQRRGEVQSPPSACAAPVRESLHHGLQRHLQTVMQLPSRQRLAYLFSLTKDKTVEWVLPVAYYPLRDRFRRAATRVCLRIGYRLPISLRSPYVLGVYRAALERYSPGVYGGSIVLFSEHDEEWMARDGWSDIATEGVDLHRLYGDHSNILEEPRIRTWAEPLKTLLNSASVRDVLAR